MPVSSGDAHLLRLNDHRDATAAQRRDEGRPIGAALWGTADHDARDDILAAIRAGQAQFM